MPMLIRNSIGLCSCSMKRTILQIIIGLVGVLLIVRFGILNILFGSNWVLIHGETDSSLDSEFRFQAGVMCAVGFVFLWMLPRIEKHNVLFPILAAGAFLGGLARVVSIVQFGTPPISALFAMTTEIAIPLICVPLQRAVAREHGQTP
jgi:hypothetical protein